jgi:polyisoprenoid-binding protein YceI
MQKSCTSGQLLFDDVGCKKRSKLVRKRYGRVGEKFVRAQTILCGIPFIFIVPALQASSAVGYRIDTTASNAVAKVAFFGLSSKTARFNSISGNVSFQPGNLKSISVNVAIDASKLVASDRVTTDRLKGEKFFWVARHPTVNFKSTDLHMNSATQGTLNGNLTARGITRPVSMNVTFSKAPAQAKGNERFTLTGKTVINRRDFGMTSYSAIVGKKVNITIEARLVGS